MSEHRKHPRFPVRQPVLLRVREEDGYRELQGTTENTSLQGAFLITDAPLTVGTEVELTILLQHGVQVSSWGKVTRVTHAFPGQNGVAVECAHPFSQFS
jgi:PilZ domain